MRRNVCESLLTLFIRYRDKIMSRLRFLEGISDSMHPENKDAVKEFIEAVKPGIERIVESLYSMFQSHCIDKC